MHQFQLSLQDLSPLPIPNRTANSINTQVVNFLMLDLKNNASNAPSNQPNQGGNNQAYLNPHHNNHNNDSLFNEVPSTLLQLPSANNFGSAIFDDPRREYCQQIGFNTNHFNLQSELIFNRCQSGTMIPDINEFSHQILPNGNNNNTLADIDNYKFESVGMERKKELHLDTDKMPESDAELKLPQIQDLLKQQSNQLLSQINPPFSPQQQESAHSLLAKFSQNNSNNILPSNFLSSLPFLTAGGTNPYSQENQQQSSANSMNLTTTPSTIPTPTSFSSIPSVGQANKVAQVSNNSLTQNSSAFSNSINSSIMAELLKKSQEKNEQKESNQANQTAESNKNNQDIKDIKINKNTAACKSATEGKESGNLINNLKQISSIILPLKGPQKKQKQVIETNSQQPPAAISPTANISEENDEDSGQNNTEIKIEEYVRKVDFCKCRKSKCLKLYCECFLRGTFCNDQCICTECGNTAGNEAERLKAIEEAKCRNAEAFNLKFQVSQNKVTHKRGCNCKKTNCLKKYCECYNAGLKCRANCKCEECKNTQDNLKSLGESASAKLSEDQQQIEENSNLQEGSGMSIPAGVSATAIIPQKERIISMSQSASSSTIMQNRKRTRSEASDQGSLPAEEDPGVRKKKSQFHGQKGTQQEEQQQNQEQQPIQQAQASKTSLQSQLSQPTQKNSSQQISQTNYNSFKQNFVFSETTKHQNPSAKKQS